MSNKKKKKNKPYLSQTEMIYRHLSEGHSLSPLEALGVYGIYRLASRINDLRNEGHHIVTRMRKDANGKQYAEYILVK